MNNFCFHFKRLLESTIKIMKNNIQFCTKQVCVFGSHIHVEIDGNLDVISLRKFMQ